MHQTIKKTYAVKLFACIPPPLYGGVTVHAKRLALDLCKHGYPSGAFYSHELIGVPPQYNYLFDKMLTHAHSFFVLPEFPYLYKVCKPYQLIHSHLSLKTIFCMWLIHKLQKKPLVITIHNEMIEKEFNGLNLVDRYCISSLFRDKSVQIICVNNKAKQLLEERFVSIANNIKVIPAYIKPVELGKALDYLSYSLVHFIETHPRYIVYYAESFVYNNGSEIYGTRACVDAFITVHTVYPDLSLVFCMPNVNDEVKLKQLKEIIADNHLEQFVYWQTSAISEMWPLLKTAAVYLRTTSTDGDSVLLREALGMGVPCLASDVVKRPEGCETYKFGNSVDLASHLKAIITSTYRPSTSDKDHFKDILEVYSSFIDLPRYNTLK